MKKSDLVNGLTWLWALPVVAPLFLILISYLTMPWSWGLMDDLTLLNIKGDLWHRVKECFLTYFNFGELKWTHALHCGIFYKMFSSSPQAFHVFKWLEVALMLFVWGLLAWRLTQRRVAFFMVPAVALSFHYLYDQFFFLSTHETTGLLFLGLALWSVACVETVPVSKFLRALGWVAGIIAFVLSLGAKETFLVGIVAAGAAAVCLGLMDKGKRNFVIVGCLMVLAGVGYGLYLKMAISRGYTEGYSFTDMPRILGNLSAWFKKEFITHVPWMMVAWWVVAATGGKLDWQGFAVWERLGLVLAFFLYGAFLLILLPWNTTSYYAGPLGVFFALFLAVFLARRIEMLSIKHLSIVIVFATAFSLAIGAYTLNREAMYHYDTQNLWQWLKGNTAFQISVRDEKVFCNGMEASVAIPGHANRWWGLGLKGFVWDGGGINSADARGARYYVFSRRFGTLNQKDLAGWQTVFYSSFWQVYRKE